MTLLFSSSAGLRRVRFNVITPQIAQFDRKAAGAGPNLTTQDLSSSYPMRRALGRQVGRTQAGGALDLGIEGQHEIRKQA